MLETQACEVGSVKFHGLVDAAACWVEKGERRLSAGTKRALHKSKVNGKCWAKHFLSARCVAFGQGGADHFIRGIFHSAGCVSSRAGHQLQGPCMRNGCRCSSAAGPKHETAASSSSVAVFKCGLPAAQTRPGQFSRFYLEKLRGLLLLDDRLFSRGSPVVGQHVLRSYLVNETSAGCFRDTVRHDANSTLPWLPLMSQNTPRIMYVHTSGFPKGRETQRVMAGALLPRLCSFIAALQPGGVAWCPDGQSQG